jgi:hypothetical protein
MSKKLDLKGKKFGQLQVLCEYSERANDKHNSYQWECQCDCGNIVIVISSYLTSGHKTSCGCLRWSGDSRRTHGLSGSKIYEVYSNMKKRCNDIKSKSYKDYGGRGIKISDKWDTFERFYNDMGATFKEGLSIERIDVNGNYCKENCTWVTIKAQANNRRSNHKVAYKGETLTISQLAEKYKKNYNLVEERINKGLNIEEAFKPVKTGELITYKEKTKTVSEFAQEYGFTYYQVKKRLMRGWNIEKALNKPLREW